MTDKEELSRGDALAKVAVLEAEVAGLRKRACVPEGYVVVPVEPTIDMSAAARRESHVFITFGEAEQVYRSMIAAAPACSGQTYPLYITHRPLIHNAINLLGMRRPVAPDVELVINGLRAMLDGMPTPAEPAAEHWIAVAQSAAPAPVERLATDGGRNQRFEGLFEGETPDQRDARLASAAPVERVEQEAVAMLLIDDATTAESGDWDIEPIPAAIEKLARSGGAALPLYTTPQPAPTAAPDVEGLLALADAVTPQIIDWVRCGLSTNGHLTDGSHPALTKLREAYCALAHQSGGAK